MLVSVIIVNWNGRECLNECLASLRRQSHRELEVIVVDNASTDGSIEQAQEQFPDVSFIVNRTNTGFARGNNIGIAAARGGWIALLNNDAVAADHWIERLLAMANRDPAIGMVASKVVYYDRPDMLNSAGVMLYPDMTAVNRGIGQADRGQYQQVDEVFCPYGAAAFYRKEMLDQISLLDEDYFMFREEDELGWRARLAGWHCVYAPGAVVRHRRSAGSGRGSAMKLYYGERNRLWTAMRYLGMWDFVTTIGYSLMRYVRLASCNSRPREQWVNTGPGPSPVILLLTLIRAWRDAFRMSGIAFNRRQPQTHVQWRRQLACFPATWDDILGQMR
jgi:GT2 family glycosyltransferase